MKFDVTKVRMINRSEVYTNSMAHTMQSPMCGNAFRLDVYSGCTFNCSYCFASVSRIGGDTKLNSKLTYANMDTLRRRFDKAMDKTKNIGKNLNLELLRRKTPLHVGGMSDPFQPVEFHESNRLAYQLIEISNKHQYPMMFSTKAAHLPDDYWKILNPELHAFQISLISDDDEYLKELEPGAPSATERMNFIKELHDRGFWVGLRVQPLIHLPHAISLIKKIDKYVNYITIEHIKLYPAPKEIKAYMLEFSKIPLENFNGRAKLELKPEIKKHNIAEIRKITNVKLGLGDNDMHEQSDSCNCCGIDTINSNFNNWIKYNSMYIKMNKAKDIKELYTPKYPIMSNSMTLPTYRKKGFGYKEVTNVRMVRQHLSNKFNGNFKVIIVGDDKKFKEKLVEKLYFMIQTKKLKEESLLLENEKLTYEHLMRRATLKKYNKRKREVYNGFIYDNVVENSILNENFDINVEDLNLLENKFLDVSKVLVIYATNDVDTIKKNYDVDKKTALDIKEAYKLILEKSKFTVLTSDGSKFDKENFDRMEDILTDITTEILLNV